VARRIAGPYHHHCEGEADRSGGRRPRRGAIQAAGAEAPPRSGPESVTRSTATILFTDLVGSTELRGRLGEEVTEDLRRRHDRLLTEAVEAHSGRVVKGLGDGIMATFAGASDAVRAAVEIQQAIDRLNRSGKVPVPLSVRVGLSAGDVTFEDDDVHGAPVIEASRLCGTALGDEILASEVVRWLGGAQGSPSLTPVGSLELKGLAAPVPAVRVEWEPTPVSEIPMPPLLTDVGRIFVGRDAELERLTQFWKEAAAGERRVALLAGEPGVGKTRLAAEVAIRVHEEGGVVLAGRCDEGLGVPYQPFVEALRHFVDHTPPAELRERLGRYGGELTRLMPEVAERVPELPAPLQSDPETERFRLFDAVAAWLTAASAEDPLLLVVDDLQWAAKPSLLLLRHVVRSPEPGRVFVVGTYRDTELTYDHPLVDVLADLRRREGVERVSLSGLDSVGVAAFVEQAAGRALGEEDLALARAIHDETEGNPFFVREVLRHLAETGAIKREEGRWGTSLSVAEVGIPEGIREVIGRRLARLSGETNRALRLASVAGTDFEVSIIGRAGDMDEDDVLVTLEEAAAARLVIEEPGGGRYRFAHALVRDTLYEALSATRRSTLHRRIGEAIEAIHAAALDDHLPALAHHWGRASAVAAATPKAVDYAARAGHRALAQLAHDEAVAYYRQALERLTATEGPVDEDARLELVVSLGEAEHRAGDPAQRETLLRAAELARRRGNAPALARAALAGTRGILPTSVGWVDQEKVAVLEAAVEAVGEGDPAARSRLLATLGVELVFGTDWRRCLPLSDEALSLARSLGDPETLARVLMARNFPTCAPGLLQERLANTAELLEVVKQVADPALVAEAHLFRSRTAFEAGQVAEADRCITVADELSAGVGQPALRWRVRYIQGARAVAAGRCADAERLLVESRELGRLTGQPDADLLFARQQVCLRLAQYRVDTKTLTNMEALGTVPLDDSASARLACELGRREQATAALEHFAATPLRTDLYWLPAMLNWAAVASGLGLAGPAAVIERELRPYADLPVAMTALPMLSVAHHLGLLSFTLGHLQTAEEDFLAAEAIHERIGAPAWLAASRLERARVLIARQQSGDAERALDLAGQALATARQLGLGGLERQAVTLLQECP
jgi:class 3 adenylate cyclase